MPILFFLFTKQILFVFNGLLAPSHSHPQKQKAQKNTKKAERQDISVKELTKNRKREKEGKRKVKERKRKAYKVRRRRSTAVWATINSNKHIQYTIYIHMFACVHVQYKPMIHRRLLSGSTIFRISKLEVDSRRTSWPPPPGNHHLYTPLHPITPTLYVCEVAAVVVVLLPLLCSPQGAD